MRIVSFYDTATGLLTGRTYGTDIGDDAAHLASVKLHTPEGSAFVDGAHDSLSKRVDLATGDVVEWQPPQPSPDYEWNADTKRWQLTAAMAARVAAHAAALASIEQLERSQARAIREHLLGDPAALARIKSIDDQIATARRALA